MRNSASGRRKSWRRRNSRSWPSAISATSGRMRTSNFDDRAMTPSSRDRRPAAEPQRVTPIAVSMGDPAGIGPDIVLASWRERSQHNLPPFVLYGCPDVLARAGARPRPSPCRSPPSPSLPKWPRCMRTRCPSGRCPSARRGLGGPTPPPSRRSNRRPRRWRGRGARAGDEPYRQEDAQPRPSPLSRAHRVPAELAVRHGAARRPRPVMMLVADELKVVPATVHIPLSAVPRALTRALLVETIRITATALAQDFGFGAPRIAVAGLNPHAGEGGLIGSEEADVIGPAIEELVAAGIAVTGPHSADTLFHAEARSAYDAAVAMYHDQALIPLKTLASTAASTSRSACRSCAPRPITARRSLWPVPARRARAASSPRCAWRTNSAGDAPRHALHRAHERAGRQRAPTACRRSARSSAASGCRRARAWARTLSSIST